MEFYSTGSSSEVHIASVEEMGEGVFTVSLPDVSHSDAHKYLSLERALINP